jgi:hypothetical protein
MSRRFHYSGQTYAGDPRQISARFDSSCSKCNCKLKKGDEIFYWPSNRKAYCFTCGESDYLQFLSSKADEEVFHGIGNPY